MASFHTHTKPRSFNRQVSCKHCLAQNQANSYFRFTRHVNMKQMVRKIEGNTFDLVQHTSVPHSPPDQLVYFSLTIQGGPQLLNRPNVSHFATLAHAAKDFLGRSQYNFLSVICSNFFWLISLMYIWLLPLSV